MESAAVRLERKYQARHQRNQPLTSENSQEAGQQDTDIIDDFSRDRDSIRRVQFVFDRILEIVPSDHQTDKRYIIMKTMFREGIKDLALVPDRILLPMFGEFGQALAFVANGSMAELEELLESQREAQEENEPQRDNAEEG